MPFVSENRLEEALVRAVESPATAPDFYRLLLESDLAGAGHGGGTGRCHLPIQPGAGWSAPTGDRRTRLVERFLPVFSSLARMQDYVKEESRYLSVNGRALLDLTRGAPVALNPGSDYGREFTPQQIEQLLDPGSRRQIAVEPGRISGGAGECADRGVRKGCRRADRLAGQHCRRRRRNPIPLVGIETTGDMAALVAEIERVAQETFPAWCSICNVSTAPSLLKAHGQRTLEGPALYERAPSPPGRFLN